MKKTTAGIPVAIVLCAVALTACNRQETAVQGETTATIAPASPQPDLTGSDALTQTVDVEGGRTELEGAGIVTSTTTDSTTGTVRGTTGTTTGGTSSTPAGTTTR